MMFCVRAGAVAALGLAAFVSLPGLCSDSARAEPLTSPTHLSGVWRIGEDFSDQSCIARLSTHANPIGYRIDFDIDCRSAFPILADVAAWRPDGEGGVVLVDNDGDTVVDYAISETDSLMSVMPDNVMLNLTPEDTDPTMVGAIATHDGAGLRPSLQ